MHHDAVVKRITISLEDDLYRIAKAYAISEDISLSKAVTRLLRRGIAGGRRTGASRVMEDLSSYTHLDARTGLLVSAGAGTIAEDSAEKAEEEEDQRKWDCE